MSIAGSCWEGWRQILLVQCNAVAGLCEKDNEPRGFTHNYLTTASEGFCSMKLRVTLIE